MSTPNRISVPSQWTRNLRGRNGQIREMYQGEPGTEAVDELVQDVGVSDTVDGCIDGEGEEKDVGYEAKSAQR